MPPRSYNRTIMGAAEFHPATSCIDQPKHQDGAAVQMEMEMGFKPRTSNLYKRWFFVLNRHAGGAPLP